MPYGLIARHKVGLCQEEGESKGDIFTQQSPHCSSKIDLDDTALVKELERRGKPFSSIELKKNNAQAGFGIKRSG